MIYLATENDKKLDVSDSESNQEYIIQREGEYPTPYTAVRVSRFNGMWNGGME